MFQDSLTKKIAEAAAQIKTEVEIVDVNEKSVEGAVSKIMNEKLVGNQHKIDANKNKKIDAHDFKLLRAQKDKEKANSQKFGKDVKEEAELTQEEFDALSEEDRNLYMEMLDSIETQLREIGLLDEEQLDEISTTAAKNYLHKALPSSSKLNQKAAKPGEEAASKSNYSYENAPYETKEFKKFSKRRTGIRKAINKLESAHPDNKKHAKVARQAFNSIHNANYRVGMGEPNDNDRANIRDAHKTVKAAVNAMHKNAMKEEAEQIVELSKDSYKNYLSTSKKLVGDHAKGSQLSRYGEYGAKDRELNTKNAQKHAMKKLKEEEIDEAMFPGTKEYEKKYGQSPQQKLKKVGDTEKTAQGEMKKTEKGVMHTRRFSEMLQVYKEGGLKSISEMLVKEEPSQEEFEKEVDIQKKRNSGEIRNDKGVAKAFQSASVREEPVNPVEEEVEEIAVIDADKMNGVQIDTIEEREMTDAEMKKREDIVKSMKKGMEGFKQRYGDRAKQVAYATATKIAKEKA